MNARSSSIQFRRYLTWLWLCSLDGEGTLIRSNPNQKAVELQPNDFIAQLNLAESYTLKGMFSEAQMQLDRLDDSHPLVRLVCPLICTVGSNEGSNEILSQLKALSTSGISPCEFAVVYAALGDKDSAFEYLHQTNPDLPSMRG
jgi:hypothetical protein